MIDRYSTKRMQKIWSEENKFNTYLKVELTSLEAWTNLGIIPKSDFDLIRKNAKLNLKRLKEIEMLTKHDVIAFTRSISETLGDEKKWFHYGLTSTDVVDTAYSVQIKEANLLILSNLLNFADILKEKAYEYKNTPVIGRTHGVHAEITSLGLKFTLWYDEMQRNIQRFKKASKNIEVGKLSGAVGNFVNTSLEIQDFVCDKLEINSSKISTQILQRDRHAEYISTLAIIATTLEKIALEIRNSQRTEVMEMMEFFSKDQKGSSAMPHKKNPIASENICGIARVLRGYVIPALENNSLWYERDISHSSVERIIIPDATNLIDYAFRRYSKVIQNLIIDQKKMKENINLTQGTIFSQRVLSFLIHKNMSREEAYDLVQKIADKAWNNKISFMKLLKKNKKINSLINNKEFEELFNHDYFLKNVDLIYERVFNIKF
ncbi:MAG: adenylosuccinate lyase [Candidatus Tyloplasma litorale]|nr:MAG: adenylosuccinate lyase [Mycoplasmatales bacterium]